MSKEQELVPAEPTDGFLVLSDPEAAQMIVEAGPTPADLQKLVVPSGTGGAAFVIETLEGETFEKTLEVVVAYESSVERAFYGTDVGDGDPGPPHCFSPDSQTGFGNRNMDEIADAATMDDLTMSEENCADCAWSKYGSALNGGKGQACKQKVRLIVFTADQLLPLVLQIPPTSLKGFRRHKLQLLNSRKRLKDTVTVLSLKKNAGPTDYYTVEFSFSRDLAADEKGRLGELAATLGTAATQN